MLVSLEEFRGYMGGMSLDTLMQENVATSMLAGVQADLEAYLNTPVELVQIRETSTTNDQGILYLSVMPTVKLLSVNRTARGALFDSTMYSYPDPMYRDTLLDADDRLVNKNQTEYTGYQVVPGGVKIGGIAGQRFTIEYIGGYSQNHMASPGFKRGILTVASRDWATNMVGTVGQRDGQTDQTEVGDARFLGWSDDELKKFQRYRRRIVLR